MTEDVLIVGGGVMGLFSAYYASEHVERVVVLERGRIGAATTASFGRTRSYRSDYLDPGYARLAREALGLWNEFEQRMGVSALVRCGCMNIAKRSVTPDLSRTYAHLSHRVMQALNIPTETLTSAGLRERFPYLDADVGYVDLEGGVVNVPVVTATLLDALASRGVRVVQGVVPRRVVHDGGLVHVESDGDAWSSRALILAAGHGTNEVLARLEGAALQVPITRDRPIEAKYFTPPATSRKQFTSMAMPVIAYLDAGIYCHPIVDGLIDKVKIGYYHPPDLPRATTVIDSVNSFVEHCLPGLQDAHAEPVDDVDGCDYDLVADDEFVLGPIPGFPAAHVGVGWRGTGYKFAPWVGQVLTQLVLGQAIEYDIGRFDPARFTQGGSDAGAAVNPDSVAAPR